MYSERSILSGVTELRSKATWEDLVLPKKSIEGLQEFILWITLRHQVEQWGKRITSGPVAIFAGQPGTGKTLAAEVIANSLTRPLFRLDLGLLVTKYIGETEKNLAALFSVATHENALLFFDEADSLFGRRSATKDPNDRYSNPEIGYLLTLVEQHRVPCIVTSNVKRVPDIALARRVELIIDFPMPDSKARDRLWRLHLPDTVRRRKGLDFALLGRQLPLSGGQIRNAALLAALLATGESSPIGWRHIVRAALREISKTDTANPAKRLGRLRRHLA